MYWQKQNSVQTISPFSKQPPLCPKKKQNTSLLKIQNCIQLNSGFLPYSFTLNTRINMPHESHVTALCFRDTDELKDETLMLVTASKDGRFKVWVLVDDSDAESEYDQYLFAPIHHLLNTWKS